MAEIHKNDRAEWWGKTLRQYRPEDVRRLQREMSEQRKRLFSSLRECQDATELVQTLRDLIFNCYALAHYAGIRRGYLIARQLQKLHKEKKGSRARAEIVRLIEAHPNWTTGQIFSKLDDAEIPVFWVGSIRRKGITRWSELPDEPAYKMFVSRLRATVRKKIRLQGWMKLMKRHSKPRPKRASPKKRIVKIT